MDLSAEYQELWKAVFHDSDAYVRSLFRLFYSPNHCLTREQEGRLVSALMAIPFDFAGYPGGCGAGRRSGESGSAGKRCPVSRPFAELKGMYLCGLATVEEKRGQGLMRQLIREAETLARDNSCPFIFLIPANDRMREYYRSQGFVDAFWRETKRYTDVHDFAAELRAKDENLASELEDYYVAGYVSMEDSKKRDVHDYVAYKERVSNHLCLVHSPAFVEAVIADLLSENGRTLIASDQNSTIRGVAFVETLQAHYADIDAVRVKYLIADNECVRYRLLQEIKNEFPEKGIVLYETAENDCSKPSAIYDDYYIGVPDGYPTLHQIDEVEIDFSAKDNSRPYGMAKMTDRKEMLNFLATQILNKNVSEVEKSVNQFSDQELSEVIFSRPSDEKLAMNAGCGRLPLSMAMMLD